ncbi:MAG: MBL fold metallo-hydrolase, partial [Clostridia bacterium]|nr:MBL fold metallo-hydrolase [Clostridia bacterium]
MKDAIYMLCGADENLEEWHKDDLLNSFIITSKGGKTVVIDGGHRFNAPHLLEKLKEVTGMEKPKVDAWFLTHLHSDHVYAFVEMMEKYADRLDVETVYYNFPTDLAVSAKEGDVCVGLFLDFYRLEPSIRAKSYIPRMGETIAVGDIKFDVLYTNGMPLKFNTHNELSLVLKMYLAEKTTLFLADCGVESGRILLEKYGVSGALKAD